LINENIPLEIEVHIESNFSDVNMKEIY